MATRNMVRVEDTKLATEPEQESQESVVKLVHVPIADTPQPPNAEYEVLAVKPKPGYDVREVVNYTPPNGGPVIGYIADQGCEVGNGSVYTLDANKVEWACAFIKGSDVRDTAPISGVPAGPFMALQLFYDAYPVWIKGERDGAIAWLVELAGHRLGDDALAARIGSAGTSEEWVRVRSELEEHLGLELDRKWRDTELGILSAPVKLATAVQKSKGYRGTYAYSWSEIPPRHPGRPPRDGYVTISKGWAYDGRTAEMVGVLLPYKPDGDGDVCKLGGT